jgi:membrane protease YdiL (CAAX protease family)
MGGPGIWSGLAESAFLPPPTERERDPGRLAVIVIGGGMAGLATAISGWFLVLWIYTALTGQAARGLAGLAIVAHRIADPSAASTEIALLRLAVGVASDGLFLATFAAVAAHSLAQPLMSFVTVAPKIRWRVLGVGLVLGAAVMAPIVLAERLAADAGVVPPLLSISPTLGGRIAYAASTLLLIPAAAAEELFFRGWLLRQLGVYLRRPITLLAVSALSFSALHLDFAPDAFLFRALMGAGFAYMTLRLGGIEFSTGVHAATNIVITLLLLPPSGAAAGQRDNPVLSMLEDAMLIGGYLLVTELMARLGLLRDLAGLRTRELSPPGGAPVAA